MANNLLSSGLRHKKLQAVIDNRFNHIETLLQKINEGFGKEDIHLFRVEIKKLKALYRLFRSSHKDSPKLKFPRRLNKIYKSLGSLRIMQIQEQKIKIADAVLPVWYIKKLHDKAAIHQSETTNLINRLKPTGQLKKEFKNHSPKEIPLPVILEFIHEKMKTIRLLLLPESPDEETMHYIRKLLKDIQYIRVYAKDGLAADPDGVLLLSDKIPSLAGILGDLHDMRDALGLLDQELKESGLSEDEKKLLSGIRNKWQTDKEIFRLQVCKKCKSTLRQESQ